MELWTKWEYEIMKEMRMYNYEWYENVKIMNDMRMSNYEWYENIKLWMIWECKIMKDMRIYSYERYIYIYYIKTKENIENQKGAPWVTDHFAYWMKFIRVLFEG